jgi:acetyl-CoA carboxylase biotin carboxyl carrier protein
MREKTIKKLIKLLEESGIDELEVTSWGRKVRVTKRLAANDDDHCLPTTATRNLAASPSVQGGSKLPVAAGSVSTEAKTNLIEIKSPMVGTFYAAPAPDAAPYVSLNQKIEVGQVVCIVEAMKLMNEIESEVAGRVAEILVENAQPVEFGQVLFLIDPEG